VTASIGATANSLAAGGYSDTVTFTNTTNGTGNTTRSVALTVNAAAGALSVSAGSLTSSGTVGGPFTPSSASYTLTNTGGTSIAWTAAKTQTWVTLSSAGGTLAAGATATVTASIGATANSLAAGGYSDTVTITNTTNGTGNTTRSVALTVNAAVLTSVTVSGPSSVNEGSTGTYTATGTWDNGTTTAISPTWSENSTYASISASGVLTASAVTSNQAVTVTATYGGRTGTMSVTIVDVPAVLSSIAVSGPSSVNEGLTGTYTATGTWDNGTTAAISPTWSVSTSYATISTGGVLTAAMVTSNQTVTVTASYLGKTGTMSVTIVHAAAVLTSIAVSGPSTVNEGTTGTYTATGTWDNGTTAAISPTWSVSTSYATISTGGVLMAAMVTANQTVTVTASYGGKTGTMSVTIVNVPGTAPAAAKNIGITGPISSGSTVVWRLTWDPVTTYANGASFESGRSVRYAVYWSDDPALSAGSLRQLASSVSATTVDFDPVARLMPVNRPAYLTVQSILDNGEPSSLAAGLEWVVANTGPAPPAAGIIKKK
jgi:hypothetical protein